MGASEVKSEVIYKAKEVREGKEKRSSE